MANTFSQIELHLVFAVKYRDSVLMDEWRDELFRYIGGTIKSHGHTALCVGGWRDHVHILVGSKPTIDIPNLVKDVKISSNIWLQPRFRCKFEWQDGYGIFSVSKTHENAIRQYIENQPKHHTTISFREEYKQLLEKNGINYDERYIFHELI